MSAVRASSSIRPRGIFRCVERCWLRTRQAGRSDSRNFYLMRAMRRRAGLGSCPRRSALDLTSKDQLRERQVGRSLPHPLVLPLALLQPLHLAGLEAAESLAPSETGALVRHGTRTGGLVPHRRSALRYKHVDLPKLRDDLFRGTSFILRLARKPYFTEDHFSGAG